MKTNALLKFLVMTMIAMSVSLTACKDDDDAPAMPLYNPTDEVFSKSQEEWQVEWWQFLMSHNCATLPTAGSEVQTGQVHFLSGRIETYSMNITVNSSQAILSPIMNYINDFPCPDTSFHPAPGQSLEDFLQEGAASFIDLAKNLEVTLDGLSIPITTEHRTVSDLFYFTGNPEIPNCFDPCVTGQSQAAISDGYWIFIKPLSKGFHCLHIAGTIPEYDLVLDGTINITVN